MACVNKVILIGNLTRDPEIKHTSRGSAVTDIGLALNRVYTSENGERKEETTFVEVTLWGRTAEIAGEYLKKGRQVYIEGRLQLDTWEDKQSGQKRSKLRVVAENMVLLNSGKGGGSGGGSAAGEDASSKKGASASYVHDSPDAEGDNIPF